MIHGASTQTLIYSKYICIYKPIRVDQGECRYHHQVSDYYFFFLKENTVLFWTDHITVLNQNFVICRIKELVESSQKSLFKKKILDFKFLNYYTIETNNNKLPRIKHLAITHCTHSLLLFF